MRLALAAILALAITPAGAEVTRFAPQARPAPAFAGAEFGSVGRYERITARATIAIDPADPRDAGIADIALAPRNAAGKVEATAEVVILRPADPARGNGTLLLEIPNRGREILGQLMNDTPGANALSGGTNAGNGYLMRQGYTLAWVGWQADLRPGEGLRLEAPVLPGVTGLSREEFLFDHHQSPALGRLTYPVATEAAAVLTVRAQAGDPRQTPPDLSFRFTGPREVTIARPEEFDAGALYELIYTAKDPTVQGMAFAAVRDIASFLRREAGPANPLAAGGAPTVRRSILVGVSQSGRFVRDYLYQGFNRDADGTPVFAGMLPHIAGTRRSFTNARFAQPGRNPTPHGDRHYPADQFPFTYNEVEDHLTGVRDGLLRRCRASNTCPRIIQTDSEYEFWGARASLLVTDTRGAPLALPEEVRAFLMAGHPHYASAQAVAQKIDRCALPVNPLQAGGPMRALLAALSAWVVEGAPPPASRYPGVAEGTLVPPAGAYPPIPALGYRGTVGPAQLVDSSVMPPQVRGEYAVLVPKPDADGNVLAGVRGPALAVPTATYTGWNPRAEGFAPGALCYNTGAVVPFAETRAAREAAGDPRLSLEERHATPAAYVAAVRQAAEALVAERLLLREDMDRAVAAAEADELDRLQ